METIVWIHAGINLPAEPYIHLSIPWFRDFSNGSSGTEFGSHINKIQPITLDKTLISPNRVFREFSTIIRIVASGNLKTSLWLTRLINSREITLDRPIHRRLSWLDPRRRFSWQRIQTAASRGRRERSVQTAPGWCQWRWLRLGEALAWSHCGTSGRLGLKNTRIIIPRDTNMTIRMGSIHWKFCMSTGDRGEASC